MGCTNRFGAPLIPLSPLIDLRYSTYHDFKLFSSRFGVEGGKTGYGHVLCFNLLHFDHFVCACVCVLYIRLHLIIRPVASQSSICRGSDGALHLPPPMALRPISDCAALYFRWPSKRVRRQASDHIFDFRRCAEAPILFEPLVPIVALGCCQIFVGTDYI